MPFDVEGARAAGYSETEIADHLAKQSGYDASGARKAGYKDGEIIQHLRQPAADFNAPPTDRQQLLASAPMRLAKGMKDPIDGAAQLLERVTPQWLSNAVNKTADAVGGEGTFLGDVLGIKGATSKQLTQDIRDSDKEYEAARRATAPRTLSSLVTGAQADPGFDALRFAGNMASPANVVGAKIAPVVKAAQPLVRQALRGAAGGAAGAALQPVMGDDFVSEKAGQVVAGGVGGAVLGPALAQAGDSAARFVQRWRNSTNTVNVTPERLREMVRAQLQADGIDTTSIPDHVFNGLADDVRGALAQGRQLDPTAALRHADFQALGLPSTQGQLTRNPAQWQREFNLSGVEGVGEPLQQTFAQQSQGITNRFRQGAQGAQERFTAGQMLGDQLRAADEVARGNVRGAYDAFRQATGRDLEVPLRGLAQDYATTLRDYGQAIPQAVRGQFEELGLLTGTQRRGLSIDDAERLLKVINKHYGGPDPAVRNSLDELRRGVQRAITEAADSSAPGAEAAHLASEARGAAAQRFQTIEGTPALRSAINNAQPDDFVRRFVVGGKVNEIESMLSLLPAEGREQVRAQTVAYLQNKAFGANAAGDGKAAQASFNQELQRIGRPKLVALLGEPGAEEMLRIGRVLAYIKQIPEGATPNTSGTGQMLTSMLGRMRGVPYVGRALSNVADRQAVQQSLSGVPTQPAELDPRTVEALARLFAPAQAAGGTALGYSVR